MPGAHGQLQYLDILLFHESILNFHSPLRYHTSMIGPSAKPSFSQLRGNIFGLLEIISMLGIAPPGPRSMKLATNLVGGDVYDGCAWIVGYKLFQSGHLFFHCIEGLC